MAFLSKTLSLNLNHYMERTPIKNEAFEIPTGLQKRLCFLLIPANYKSAYNILHHQTFHDATLRKKPFIRPEIYQVDTFISFIGVGFPAI